MSVTIEQDPTPTETSQLTATTKAGAGKALFLICPVN